MDDFSPRYLSVERVSNEQKPTGNVQVMSNVNRILVFVLVDDIRSLSERDAAVVIEETSEGEFGKKFVIGATGRCTGLIVRRVRVDRIRFRTTVIRLHRIKIGRIG